MAPALLSEKYFVRLDFARWFQRGGEVELIRQGVLRFRSHIFPSKKRIYESLAETQVPLALFLACGDSRIDPLALTGTEPGQVFVERTPGNIVPTYDEFASVGVSASIEYAVSVLRVRDVIVCGHSACGAMKALLHPEELAHLPATARWLKHAEPAVQILREQYRGLDETAKVKTLAQLNVAEQLKHLQSHPAVQDRLLEGSLGIHGWFYEIHTGIIEAYNPATGIFEQWPNAA